MVDDLAAVVDAAGLDRFPLIGFCHGGPIGIAYAARHPSASAASCCPAPMRSAARRRLDSEIDRAERGRDAEADRGRLGPGQPGLRQVFTSKAVPGASADVFAHFNALQRASASAETAIALTRLFWDIDVVDLLPRVRCPTLVLHARRDAVVPFEQGPAARRLDRRGPARDARIGETTTCSPASRRGRSSSPRSEALLDRHDAPADTARAATLDALTAREHQVLDAIARGLDNAEIAEALHLSDKTIRNHVSNLFSKLQVTSRNRAIVLAREAGFGADPRRRPGRLRLTVRRDRCPGRPAIDQDARPMTRRPRGRCNGLSLTCPGDRHERRPLFRPVRDGAPAARRLEQRARAALRAREHARGARRGRRPLSGAAGRRLAALGGSIGLALR
jgi:DNA-binding CsgD family transcriptional regulator